MDIVATPADPSEIAADRALRAGILTGDDEALNALEEQLFEPLYRFAWYRLGRDPHATEEVVQATFVDILERMEAFEPERGRLFVWAAYLCRNRIRSHHRKMARFRPLEAFWQRLDGELLEAFRRLNSEPLPDELLERRETREMVGMALSQLPPDYQWVLEAKYFEGHSVRQMARSRDRTEKAVESLLFRARQAFRKVFESLESSLRASLSGVER